MEVFTGFEDMRRPCRGVRDKDTPDEEQERVEHHVDDQQKKKDPPPPRPPSLPGEEEHLRARLPGGRTVRVLFQGDAPTQVEIGKLIDLLESLKDSYPEK